MGAFQNGELANVSIVFAAERRVLTPCTPAKHGRISYTASGGAPAQLHGTAAMVAPSLPPPTQCVVRTFSLGASDACSSALSPGLVGSLFLVALRAVITVGAVASVGASLRAQGALSPAVSSFLAYFSMNVAIPALLFTQGATALNRSLLRFAWPLVLLPAVYVSLGLLLGSCTVRALQPLDADSSRFVLAACAFGNSTGLPLVLLTLIRDALLSPAVRQQYGDGVDPLSYLALYLLTYPLLQWTVGATLTGLGSRDAGGGDGGDAVEEDGGSGENGEVTVPQQEAGRPLTTSPSATRPLVDMSPSDTDAFLPHAPGGRPKRRSITDWLHARASPRWRRRAVVLRTQLLPQLLNPPVLATLAGGAVGLLPPVVTKALSNSFSPLGWVIPAAKQLSGAAVPINLLLLGSSLHAALSEAGESAQAEESGRMLARVRGVVGAAGGTRLLATVAVTKLVLHPLCAAVVCAALRALLPAVPDPYDDAFWLTALLLAATPTANNVLVMVSAAGGDTRRASAAIAAQYLAAPLLLTGSVSLFLVVIATKV